MPITERWLDDTKTTLLAEYIGAYTREDNQKSFEKRKMLCAEVDYPIGVIEDQSRGYYVKHLNAPAPIDSGSIYVGVQAFSHRSHIYRNRIAITICIPYKLGDGDTQEAIMQSNAVSKSRLQSTIHSPNLDNVSETLMVGIDEAKQIILDYLSTLESNHDQATL